MNINFEYYKIFYYVAKYHYKGCEGSGKQPAKCYKSDELSGTADAQYLICKNQPGRSAYTGGRKTIYVCVGSYASVINGRGRTGGLFGHGTWKYIDRSQRDSVKYIFV